MAYGSNLSSGTTSVNALLEKDLGHLQPLRPPRAQNGAILARLGGQRRYLASWGGEVSSRSQTQDLAQNFQKKWKHDFKLETADFH